MIAFLWHPGSSYSILKENFGFRVPRFFSVHHFSHYTTSDIKKGSMSTYAGGSLLRRGSSDHYGFALRGYISPENDPEFSDNAVNVRRVADFDEFDITIDEDDLLPVPKEGDIVRYPSKWKDEFDVGRVRNMFYSTQSKQWMVDILPLIDGKSDNVRNVDRKVKPIIESISRVQPIQTVYLRSENGYKIFFRNNSSEMILKAQNYRPLDEDFVFKLKSFNVSILQNDLSDYEELKARIIKGTLTAGVVGSLFTLGFFGPEVSIPYLCG